jgi:hypothetical protein
MVYLLQFAKRSEQVSDDGTLSASDHFRRIAGPPPRQIFDRLIAPDPFMNCPLYELGHILSKIPSAGHSFQNLLVWLATSYSEMVRQAVEATWAMALHRNIGAPGANASRPKQ